MIDPLLLPSKKIEECFRSVLKSNKFVQDPSAQGLYLLRQKIAQRLQQRGIDTSADEIIITNGSQQAIDLVSRALKKKTIATEDPGYNLAKRLFNINDVKIINLRVDPFTGINSNHWCSQFEKYRPSLVYLTTNFQNPNGYSYSSTELNLIVTWAKHFNFGIFEDDWGSEMLSHSKFSPGLRAMGGKNVFYTSSFTKKLMPSLRIGHLVASKSEIESLVMIKRASSLGVPTIIEYTLFEYLDRGYYDSHLEKLQAQLDFRYHHCLDFLRTNLPPEIRFTTPGGGPVLWLELPNHIDCDVLSNRLLKSGVLINNSGKNGIRIGYAFLPSEKLEKALIILTKELYQMMK